MEEKQYTSLTVPPDYMQYWYNPAHQFEGSQHVQYQYHQMMPADLEMGSFLKEEEMLPEECPPVPFQQLQPEPEPELVSVADVPKGQKKKAASDSKKSGGKKANPQAKSGGKQEKITDTYKVKRKVDRFNGVSEAEILLKTLPDILVFNLDIVIIGINPGLMAAFKGHHYPGPGNHFWKCLFLSGLSESQLSHLDDHTLPEKYGIGFTNMVERTTPGSKDLSSKEFREGGRILLQKLQKYKPRIAVFNGKCIYEIFSKEVFGVKVKNFDFGLQPYKVPETETFCYVMPSSSARCAQFPRAQDKVHYYIKLKELRDHLKGVNRTVEVEEVDYSFDLKLAQEDAKKMAIKEEKFDPGYEDAAGGAAESSQCNFTAEGRAPVPNSEYSPETTFGQINTENSYGQIPETSYGQLPTKTSFGQMPSGTSFGQLPAGTSFGQLPDGQWVSHSFVNQLASYGSCNTNQHTGNNETSS
ncbi:G/T mismatch-specific thymine DNA glycosylase isoform X1 [Protopterus annectens]|uniref:G/T mismatch-specific thymine DNA glycosylase isoform X1 n=1 Tax=Protopterus annectens TaxID=7888 RepID=UPI001CFBDDA5|nr:G/T mismatch-specific thymine DNA glycosylase isoform X1 [Protopterus annectens]XP_043943774.1 G/T mismatch-specific thymine DNA glycosylase isoform X1 [Protopterus annectens]XP_043943775.1 G/T mismatch-specific thymine DNA glycosylase isoform X1 [Protopterus annectens]